MCLAVVHVGEVYAEAVQCARYAYGEGTVEETAGLAAVIHADGDDVVLVPADAACLHVNGIAAHGAPCRLVAVGIARHTAQFADETAIKITLVGIVGLWQVEDNKLLLLSTFEDAAGDGHVDAVPGIAVVDGIALIVPVLGHVDGLPVGIVRFGLSPTHVVALMETGSFDAHVLSIGTDGGDGHYCQEEKSFHTVI